MNLDELSKMVTFLLGISLAAERVVTILKTAFPLLEDNRDPAAHTSAWNLRWRPLTIQLLTFVFCCTTSALLTPAGLFANPFTTYVTLGSAQAPVVIVGLLASGGSAFWSNILGYTKAVKDIQKNLAAGTAPAVGEPPAPPAPPRQIAVPAIAGATVDPQV